MRFSQETSGAALGRREASAAGVCDGPADQSIAPWLRRVHQQPGTLYRVIARFLLEQAGLQCSAADTGAITLILRLGSAANLKIHLHCLVLDGMYRRTEGESVFEEARAPATSCRACSIRSSPRSKSGR